MINQMIFSVQISCVIIGSQSNLIQPEYSIKIVNTENTILSLGEIDDDDELEIIKKGPDDSDLEKKLYKFHKFMRKMGMTQDPIEKFFCNHKKYISYTKEPKFSYSNPQDETALKRKHFNGRKHHKKKHHHKKRKWLKKFRLKKKWNLGLEKREVATIRRTEDSEIEFDYLEKEYENLLETSIKNKTVFKISEEEKPKKNIKDMIHKITDVKTPKNCTNFPGVGVQAVECLVKNFRDEEIDKTEFLHKTCSILSIWILIWMAFAIPLWCTKGWCCWCFRCSFCFPTRTVRDIQSYISKNPPGVFVNEKGEEEHYNASIRETELYEQLKRAVMDF